MSSSSDIRPDEHSVPPTGRRREPVAGAESCCGIRRSKRLELEQGLDHGTQASVGVCEEKGSRETHSSQGAFAQGHIHGSGRKRRKERKKGGREGWYWHFFVTRVVVKLSNLSEGPIRESGPGTRLTVSPTFGPDFKFSKLQRRSAPDYQFSGTQPDC
jgi:hypothetical protein